MDALDRTIQHPAVWAVGCAVALGILAYIVATRPQPVAECGPARWALACYRWEAAGWPPCSEALPDVQIVDLTPAMHAGDEDLRGAWDEELQIVAVRADSCGPTDPTVEHEQGHARGLDHGGPTGGVMASPWERTGLAIPAYQGAP